MRLATALFLTLLLCGCGETFTKDATEPATVVDVVYTPSNHGSGLGLDMTGKGGISLVEVDVAEKYAVVFECQHGKFIVQGEKGSNAYKQWTKLKTGQNVIVSYQEKYEKDDEKVKLVGYHFLDASPVTLPQTYTDQGSDKKDSY